MIKMTRKRERERKEVRACVFAFACENAKVRERERERRKCDTDGRDGQDITNHCHAKSSLSLIDLSIQFIFLQNNLFIP